MRRCLLPALAGALTLLPQAALAADGAAGATSTGTVMIRISAPPRAFQIDSTNLCVSAPTSGVSLRSAEGGATIAATPTGGCAYGGQQLALPPALQASGQTVLIVAE